MPRRWTSIILLISTFTRHTQASLLDGAILIPDLVQHLQECGMTSCGVSEHGWMASAVEFYKACKKANIKPLLGVEAYITDDPDGLHNEKKNRDNMHMGLIAKDNEGYKRLLQIVSHGALNNFYYKPRIYKDNLRTLKGHVVAFSGCLGGVFARRLNFKKDQYGRATEAIDENSVLDRELNFYLDVFGEDFYLELQGWDSGDRFQPTYNRFLLEFGKKHHLPFVLTADAHYLKKEDDKLHEFLMAMQMKMTVEHYRENSEMLYGPHFYVADSEEMLRRAQTIGCEEAYYNTGIIADKCNVELQLGKYQEPVFDITQTDDYHEFLEFKRKKLGPEPVMINECIGHTDGNK